MKSIILNSRKVIIIISLLFLMCGCLSLTPPHSRKEGGKSLNAILKDHVVMFNLDGHPVDPTGNNGCKTNTKDGNYTYCEGKYDIVSDYPRLPEKDFRTHIRNIFEKAKEHARDKEKVKLLFFVHGGLNTQLESLERIVGKGPDTNKKSSMLFDLITEESPDYYPVFINWQSFLTSSYGDHLFYVRQGKKWPALQGWLTAPVVLAVDIGRSLLRAPLVWGSMIYNDAKTAPELNRLLDNDQNLPDEVVKELLCMKTPDPTSCITQFNANKAPATFSKKCWNSSQTLNHSSLGQNLVVGVDERRCPEMAWNFTQWLLTIPTKLVISPFLDAFGKSAWDNMLRSIQLLYQAEEKFPVAVRSNKSHGKLSERSPNGGLSIFFNELVKEIHKDNQQKKEWEITLVAHSAGTIITNEAIRRFGLHATKKEELPFDKIIYMAAASTLKDLEASVYPYLQKNQSAVFHHLMLHEKAEEGETIWKPFDLSPRGSLLVWIDEFLSNPLTHKDRTAGKYQNFFRDYPFVPETIRNRMYLRVFSNGDKARPGNPVKHGEFTTRFRYWDPICWKADLDQTNNACVYP